MEETHGRINMSPLHKQGIIQLHQIPELKNKGILDISPTDKGLVNFNYQVKTLSGIIQARINRPHVLGVNREHEAFILRRIQALKIAPKTLVNNVQENYLLTEFVDLPEWSKQDCYHYQDVLIKTLKNIHAIDLGDYLPNFLSRLESYEAKSLKQFGIQDKEKYWACKHALIELEFFQHNKLLHYDLNASNLLGTKKLTIIDWEFAGCGHPIFDMAIFIYYNKLEVLKCESVINYCYGFENGAEIFKHSIKLAGFMIKMWEAQN
jgi:thiamine kinase-like enzyme